MLPIIYLTKKKPDLSHIDHLRHTKVYKISDTISAKSEKFEAIEVKDHFHGYKSTSFWLFNNEELFISQDVEFYIEDANL